MLLDVDEIRDQLSDLFIARSPRPVHAASRADRRHTTAQLLTQTSRHARGNTPCLSRHRNHVTDKPEINSDRNSARFLLSSKHCLSDTSPMCPQRRLTVQAQITCDNRLLSASRAYAPVVCLSNYERMTFLRAETTPKCVYSSVLAVIEMIRCMRQSARLQRLADKIPVIDESVLQWHWRSLRRPVQRRIEPRELAAVAKSASITATRAGGRALYARLRSAADRPTMDGKSELVPLLSLGPLADTDRPIL